MSNVRKVARNIGIIISGSLIQKLLTYVFIVSLARYLGTEDFGKYNFVFAYVAFFFIFSDFGLYRILVRELSRNEIQASKLISNASALKLITTLIAIILAILVIFLLPYPEETRILVSVAAFFLIFNSFATLFSTILQANIKMEYDVLANLTTRIISLGLVLWLINIKGSLIQIIIVVAFSEIVYLSINFFSSRKFVKGGVEFDFRIWQYLLKESLPLAVSGIFWIVYFRIDVLMLSLMKGDASIGYYSAAYQLSEPFLLIPQAIMISLFPLMSSYFKESSQQFNKSYRLAFKYLLILALPIAIGITFISDKIILLIYGEQFSPSAIALSILIWATALMFFKNLYLSMTTSIGKQLIIAKISCMAVIFNIALNLILIPQFDFMGASIVTLMTEALILSLYLIFTRNYFEKINLFKTEYLKIFIINFILMAILVILSHYTEVDLLLIVPALILAYFLFLFILDLMRMT